MSKAIQCKGEIRDNWYTEGKKAYLVGLPIEHFDSHFAARGMEARHDWRMGWWAARGNKRDHPDWTDHDILMTPSI